jgi:hypothetical protein
MQINKLNSMSKLIKCIEMVDSGKIYYGMEYKELLHIYGDEIDVSSVEKECIEGTIPLIAFNVPDDKPIQWGAIWEFHFFVRNNKLVNFYIRKTDSK